ncbi:hypothetical protein D3C85_1556900 [compost metagenome]
MLLFPPGVIAVLQGWCRHEVMSQAGHRQIVQQPPQSTEIGDNMVHAQQQDVLFVTQRKDQ